MQLEEIVNDGEDIPKAKELSQHISDEVFKKDEIADVYFITEEKTRMVFVPQERLVGRKTAISIFRSVRNDWWIDDQIFKPDEEQ